MTKKIDKTSKSNYKDVAVKATDDALSYDNIYDFKDFISSLHFQEILRNVSKPDIISPKSKNISYKLFKKNKLNTNYKPSSKTHPEWQRNLKQEEADFERAWDKYRKWKKSQKTK